MHVSNHIACLITLIKNRVLFSDDALNIYNLLKLFELGNPCVRSITFGNEYNVIICNNSVVCGVLVVH